MPKYEGQLEINWLQEKGGKQRDRGQELPRCTFSHGNALSAMSHTKVMLHLPRGRTGELNKKDWLRKELEGRDNAFKLQ